MVSNYTTSLANSYLRRYLSKAGTTYVVNVVIAFALPISATLAPMCLAIGTLAGSAAGIVSVNKVFASTSNKPVNRVAERIGKNFMHNLDGFAAFGF